MSEALPEPVKPVGLLERAVAFAKGTVQGAVGYVKYLASGGILLSGAILGASYMLGAFSPNADLLGVGATIGKNGIAGLGGLLVKGAALGMLISGGVGGVQGVMQAGSAPNEPINAPTDALKRERSVVPERQREVAADAPYVPQANLPMGKPVGKSASPSMHT